MDSDYSDKIPAVMSHVGNLLFVGFEGTELTGPVRDLLVSVRPGGVILFKRNIIDAEQTLRLIDQIKSLYDPRPVLAVDEEGGQVSRLRSLAPTLPPMADLSRHGDVDAVRNLAAGLGRVLAGLGFDLDFAPVVDLCRPDAPNGIGDRSFGTDPEIVVKFAGAYLDGLAEAGIAGCLKHFPGLGPTLFDSHHHLPTVQKEEGPFVDNDLVPYKRLHGRVPVVMVGHGHYPFLAGPNPTAGTLVKEVVMGLLRDAIGFGGLALADDLEMKAVAARIPSEELAPRTIAAGCDMALVCRQKEAIETSRRALEETAGTDRLDTGRLDEALARVEFFRSAVLGLRPPDPSMAAFRSASADLSGRLQAAQSAG